MTSFLKKLQLLKRKSLDSDESLLEQKRNHREVPNPTHQPSGSHDPASQRTSQLLPLLIKPTPSPTPEAKKKPPPPPLVLPELAQQQPSKASVASSKPEERQKEATILPKLPAKVLKSSSSTGKKKQPGTLEETAPLSELSDENFRYIWDSKILPRGKSVREVVEMLDEREVLDTILIHLQQMVQAPAVEPKQTGRKRLDMATAVDSDHKLAAAGPLKLSKTPSKEKTSLYRYYGLKLRDTTHKEVVSEYVHMLLGFSTQDEADQEGISEAISLAASSHLREILMALRDYGNMMGARRSLLLEKTSEDAKSNTAVRVRTTLILCYGHAAVGAKPEDMLMQAELIVSELLYQFRGDPKDETLKKTFMKSVVMISKAFQDIQKEDILFPHKSELVICIIEVIDEEPVGSFSFAVLHQALTTICCMTSLKPPLDYEVKYDLVRKSVKKVFSLPSLKMTKLKAGSPTHPTLTQDFYLQTIQACNVMLTSLLSETPNMEGLQEILIHTNGWIESEKTYERERAVKSTSHVLKFVSEHLDFDVSQEFSLLGQLVALLALRTVDNVKEIGLQAAEAMYHLHYITMSRMVKELEKKHKNKKGNVVKWFREDFFIPGPAVFYNNIAKVAKAFGEHLGTNHITDLVLKVIDHLVHEEKAISRAAAVLLSSFLDECGMDVEDLPMIIKEIYNHLSAIRDSETKEETIKAVCNLASKRLNRVVDSLLESSVDCDNNAMELWKALVADPYANVKLMKPLLKWLQDEEPLLESSCRRNSKTHMPMAATNALCWILSLPEASEVVQGKFPQLLLALVTQIYYTFGTSRRASKRSNASDCPDPRSAMSSAVQALKNLISCIGFIKEYNILSVQGCWEKLQHPDSYFEGVFNLVRILFMFSKVHLKMTFKQANTYLRHMEIKERTVGMAFFTELLVFSEIGLLFVKQDILDVLRDWMVQPCPLMQVFSIRGLGHLLQHPVEDESLEGILPPLMSCAFDPDRNIAKESIKTLQYLFRHLEVEEYGSMGISLISHLLKYFNDEDNHLRNDSIVLFGTLLKGAGATDSNRHSVKEDVFLSHVPLLIQLADPFTKEVSKDVLITCTNFMKWGDIPKEVFEIENYTSLHYLYFTICKHLMRKYRNRLPEMLNQTVHYLKSKFASYREAAATLIGNYAPYMTSDVVSTKDTEDTYLAVRELQGDCETSVSNAAISAIEQLFQYCGNRISHHLIPHQLIPVLRSSLEKAKLEERK